MMNARDQFIIYFIKPVGMAGPIKIGISNNPERRLNEFKNLSPFELEMIGTAPGTWADEQFLHGCLAEDHSHGEWFHTSPQVLDAVNRVVSSGGVAALREVLSPVASVRSIKNRSTRAKKNSKSAATTAGPSHLNPKPPFGLLGAAANSFSSAAILPVGSNSGSAVFSRSALPTFISSSCGVVESRRNEHASNVAGVLEITPQAGVTPGPHDSTLRILKLQRAQ